MQICIQNKYFVFKLNIDVYNVLSTIDNCIAHGTDVLISYAFIMYSHCEKQ